VKRDRSLRVVHMFPCLYLGGAEQHTLRLIKALSPRHRFSLLAPDGPGAHLFDDEGIPRRKFRRLETDLLGGFSSVRSALAAEAASHPIDVIHVHVEAALLWFARKVLPDVPRVYTNHGIVGGAALKFRMTAFAMNRWSDLSCAVSQHDLDRFVQAGAKPGKLRLVQNGVPVPAHSEAGTRQMAQRFGLDRQRHIAIGILARLEPEKGLDLLIRAVANVRKTQPQVRLVIAGSGSQEKRLRALAAELGCADAVVFAGFVREVGDFLACLDIYAQPSRAEAFGLGVTEAMAMGLPVVATRVGGLPEQVVSGKTGLLVPGDDAEALGEALYRLAADADERKRMGTAARIRHTEHFSEGQLVRHTEDVYYEALALRRHAA
jgi:glycosyltransferase involved in cell wall biosynthesis